MDIIRPLHALGMSSGTALDGVDVALLKTDGVDVYDFGLSQRRSLDEELRDKIRSVLGKRPETPENEAAIREVETGADRVSCRNCQRDYRRSGRKGRRHRL